MTGESVPDFSIMPGLVPGIHVLLPYRVKDVDGRDTPGHDSDQCPGNTSPNVLLKSSTCSGDRYLGFSPRSSR